MSFLRPEAVRKVMRFGEPALWLGVTAWAGWQAWRALAYSTWQAAVFGLIAAVAALGVFAAIQRTLLAARHGGTGMVMIEEGRITYLGPFGGTAVAIDLMISVGIETGDARTGPLWDLRDAEGRRLLIPADAAGAEKLPDTLAQLDGYEQMAVIRALRARGPGYFHVWRRRQPVRIGDA